MTAAKTALTLNTTLPIDDVLVAIMSVVGISLAAAQEGLWKTSGFESVSLTLKRHETHSDEYELRIDIDQEHPRYVREARHLGDPTGIADRMRICLPQEGIVVLS
ncbi:hypothetical protein [Enhygromyxa salina]|uniref:hypothetical protein n=1 Tax=Enhygromyxa salina TaxID=215803 RepID=UPI0011BAACB1|nr:hypothetical protein [Enhygromyxa salina]